MRPAGPAREQGQARGRERVPELGQARVREPWTARVRQREPWTAREREREREPGTARERVTVPCQFGQVQKELTLRPVSVSVIRAAVG